MDRLTHAALISRRRLLKAGGGALKNYSPNLGYDWGGRVTAAWLDP
jgi:hypothetical protein